MRSSTRGYSLIEVMTAVAIMMVGATGLILLQGATTRGNTQAQEATVAVTVAQAWIERLRRESLAWQVAGLPTSPNLSQLVDVPYLALPTYAGSPESALADYYGFDTIDPNLAKFHVRLQNTVLHVNDAALVDALRVDLTVYWFRAPGNSADDRVGSLSPVGYAANTLISDALLGSPHTRKVYASVVIQPNAGIVQPGAP